MVVYCNQLCSGLLHKSAIAELKKLGSLGRRSPLPSTSSVSFQKKGGFAGTEERLFCHSDHRWVMLLPSNHWCDWLCLWAQENGRQYSIVLESKCLGCRWKCSWRRRALTRGLPGWDVRWGFPPEFIWSGWGLPDRWALSLSAKQAFWDSACFFSERHIYQHWMITTIGRDILYTSVSLPVRVVFPFQVCSVAFNVIARHCWETLRDVFRSSFLPVS